MLISFNGSKVSAKSLAVLKKQAAKSGKVIRIYGYRSKSTSKAVSIKRAKAIKAALLKINKNFDVRVIASSSRIARCNSVKNNCAVVIFSRK